MSKFYSTSQIATKFHIHPNTVRKYEALGLLSTPKRQANNYRVFTTQHCHELRILQLAFAIELTHCNLRSIAFELVKQTAKQHYHEALALADTYLVIVKKEKTLATNAVANVSRLLLSQEKDIEKKELLSRKQLSNKLNITLDTIRNWERNGLISSTKGNKHGAFYDESNVNKALIISTLKHANFSLTAILNMLLQIENSSYAPEELTELLLLKNKPFDIYSAYDELFISLDQAIENIEAIKQLITNQLIR